MIKRSSALLFVMSMTLFGALVFSRWDLGPTKSATPRAANEFHQLPVADAQTTGTLPKLKEGQPLPNDLFVKLARAINPAVVNISTSYLPKRPMRDPRYGRDPMLDLFEQFMGPMGPVGPMQQKPAESLGTGFIIREDGLIVTNNHVIDKADVVKVQLNDKDEKLWDAKVVGRDSKTDVALIKIEAPKALPVAPLGTSADLAVGEWVAAFGNPYGHGHTMTKGIISAIGREIDEINLAPFLQTDASINPGNSGGPLVNTQGQVIGVNTAIDPRAQGIGFAIPIDYIKTILPQLEKEGTVRRGFIGIQMGEMNEEMAAYLGLKNTDGAFVVQVVPASPAAKAGFREDDVITEMDSQKIRSWRDVQKIIARADIGKEISAKVFRGGKTVNLKVKIGNQPVESRQANAPAKRYEGQKAPLNLGFRVMDYSPAILQELGLPPSPRSGPIVIDLDMNGVAMRSGLAVGDVILDVNLRRVGSAKELLNQLKAGRNVLRIWSRGQVVLRNLDTGN